MESTTQTIIPYFRRPDNPAGFQGGGVWQITEDSAENLWLATDNALTKFNLQTERQGLALELRTEIAHKIELLQSGLTSARQLLNTSQIEQVADQLDSTLQILAQMGQYVTHATTTLPQPTTLEQDVSQSPLLKLTEREREVLQLLAQGKTSSEISKTLSITAASVHTYSRRIKDKLDIRDIPGLIKFAMDHNLVS